MSEILDWEKATAHFDKIRKEYQGLEGVPGVNTTAALRIVFDPLSMRYNRGERSRDLYDAMLNVS
jgi:hypothetical protein